jgi:hypothetical protein
MCQLRNRSIPLETFEVLRQIAAISREKNFKSLNAYPASKETAQCVSLK